MPLDYIEEDKKAIPYEGERIVDQPVRIAEDNEINTKMSRQGRVFSGVVKRWKLGGRPVRHNNRIHRFLFAEVLPQYSLFPVVCVVAFPGT